MCSLVRFQNFCFSIVLLVFYRSYAREIFVGWKFLINLLLDILFHNHKYLHEFNRLTMLWSFHLKLFHVESNKYLNYMLMAYIFYQYTWLCGIRMFWSNPWTKFSSEYLQNKKKFVFVVCLETGRELCSTLLYIKEGWRLSKNWWLFVFHKTITWNSYSFSLYINLIFWTVKSIWSEVWQIEFVPWHAIVTAVRH